MITLRSNATRNKRNGNNGEHNETLVIAGIKDSTSDSLIDLARQCRQVKPTRIEIVGQWIWLEFASKPSVEDRDWLKSKHFRFNPKRVVWQFAGVPSRRSYSSNDAIKHKYNAQSISEDE